MGKRRIGFLLGSPRPSPGTSPNWDAIVEALRELGYTEGQNVVFEYAYTEGEPDRRKREVARLVAIKPDIIVAAVEVVRSVAIDGADGFDGAFGRVREARLDGVFVVSNPFMTLHRRRLAELAARYGLPAIYEISLYVTAGGLMSYGPDAADLFRRAALYVDKIFKGAKPADLPIEQPSRFDLAINLKAARAIGLTIPQALLVRATQVIDP